MPVRGQTEKNSVRANVFRGPRPFDWSGINAFVENVRALGEADPPSSDRFCPAIGGQADANSASSDRLGPLGIPVHPASLIRLAGVTFMILGVALIRTSPQKMMRP